jgi:cobalt/nickel transport system permease protein
LLLPALVAPALFRYLRDGRSEAVWWRSAAMAAGYILHVIVMAVVGLIALFVESIGRRAPFDPAFRAGFGTGVTVVLLTSLLNCLVLVAGGVEDWRVVAAVSFAAHLPLAVIEGLVVGSVASFLGRVKPEMLRG